MQILEVIHRLRGRGAFRPLRSPLWGEQVISYADPTHPSNPPHTPGVSHPHNPGNTRKSHTTTGLHREGEGNGHDGPRGGDLGEDAVDEMGRREVRTEPPGEDDGDGARHQQGERE